MCTKLLMRQLLIRMESETLFFSRPGGSQQRSWSSRNPAIFFSSSRRLSTAELVKAGVPQSLSRHPGESRDPALRVPQELDSGFRRNDELFVCASLNLLFDRRAQLSQPPGHSAIQSRINFKPSTCVVLRPCSGIITPVSCEAMRNGRIESSGLPGTMSNR